MDDTEQKRTAPVQGYGRIPWALHVRAWEAYHVMFPNHQTAERLAERGGFDVAEMNLFVPGWEMHSDV